jgi:protoporphyrinogen oxidase
MKTKSDVLIIGAGISGCAAAQELQAKGIDFLLLEKNAEAGGLTRSISLGDAHFDYTGHFLHLARSASPAKIPYAKQNDEDWQYVERKSVVYIKGSIIPAPFQYNLFALPEETRYRCISDFRTRTPKEASLSFREYLISGFGLEMCKVFFFPYIEKQMAISLDELSIASLSRFFPCPDEEKIERGYANEKSSVPDGYNSYFWYPKYDGIGLLARGLSQDIQNLSTCCAVEKIDLRNKRVNTSFGDICYERLITSMPLKRFGLICDDQRLHMLASLLSHNKVLCLNLLIKGSFHQSFEGCHWIYTPDKDIPFYRVGIYSNIPKTVTPSACTAVYIEVAYADPTPLPHLINTINVVLDSLENLNWIHRKDCLAISANWIDCAYVHFNHIRQETVNEILNILRDHHVYPIGRYGLWDYISMEDSIFSGIEVARRISNDDLFCHCSYS